MPRTQDISAIRSSRLVSCGAVLLVTSLLFAGCARDRASLVRFTPGECPEGTSAREETLDDGNRRAWCELGEGEETIKHGPFSSWHPSGRMASAGSYVHGLEDGPFTIWFENGEKSQEGSFRRGLPHGRWMAWLEDGTPVYIMDFRDGEVVCGEDPLQPRCAPPNQPAPRAR